MYLSSLLRQKVEKTEGRKNLNEKTKN